MSIDPWSSGSIAARTRYWAPLWRELTVKKLVRSGPSFGCADTWIVRGSSGAGGFGCPGNKSTVSRMSTVRPFAARTSE